MASRPSPGLRGRGANRAAKPSLLLIAAACLVGTVGVGNAFTNDDILLIETNPRVQSLSEIVAHFSRPYWPPPYPPDLFRPLLSTLHTIEMAFFGGSALGFRLVSLCLSVGVALALFLFLRQRSPLGAALAAALVFSVHPIHVEANALAVAQNELAIAWIAIASTSFFLESWERPPRKRWPWLLLAFVACVLLKETGYVLPLFWLAAGCVYRGRAWRRSDAVGFASLGVLALGMLAWRRSVLPTLAGTFVAPALEHASMGVRGATMLGVVVEWTRLLLWPAHLRVDYSPQEFVAATGLGPAQLLGALICVGGVVVAWRARNRAPLMTLGVAWMVIALLPVSNVLIPTGVLIAERTLYLPSVGFAFVLAGVFALPVVERFRKSHVTALNWCFVVLIALGALRSAERYRTWRNQGVLSARSARNSPRSYRAQRDLAIALFDIGRDSMAVATFAKAEALAPAAERREVLDALYKQYRQRGMVNLEAAVLERSLAANAEQPTRRAELIEADLYMGRYQEARKQVDWVEQHGENNPVFTQLGRLADSAATHHAPPGSIRIDIVSEVVH